MLEHTACTAEFQGGEGQSVFPIPFPFLETSHIRTFMGERGHLRGLTPGVDFTINKSASSNGELILLGEALPSGHILSIQRHVPITQEIYFHNQGPNSPKASEEGFDKLTMIAQQHANAINRCLPAPDNSNPQEVVETLLANAGAVRALDSSLQSLGLSVGTKADAGHSHPVEEVHGLAASLAGKAGTAELVGRAPLSHAAAHRPGGSDPLTPAVIGAMFIAPADGKTYMAAGSGWLEYIAPSIGGEGGGGTTDHAALHNCDAPNQHPQSSIQYLEHDLHELRDSLGTVETVLLPDAPADGEYYGRHNGAWSPVPASSGSGNAGAGALLGEIRLLPFRAVDLPTGWYFCNSDRFPLSSPQGTALAALPDTYKADWGIVAEGGAINVPSLFHNGKGYFLRPADNVSRMPGAVEPDAIRNITGSALAQSGMTVGLLSAHESLRGEVTGAFVRGAGTANAPGLTGVPGSQLRFDASAAVPTADENRPVNIAMTPAIYLGV